MDKKKKIVVVCRSTENLIPSQRFRFELYKDLLERNNFDVTYKHFFDKEEYEILYKHGFLGQKVLAIAKGFLRRCILFFEIKRYDYVFLQKAAAPLGPPFFEWLYGKVLKRRIIYDFDDAIWIPHTSEQNKIARFFKRTGKVKNICRWAYKVSCGNDYLCNYARQYNKEVVFNPTCVDTEKQHNIIANHDVERVTIGWTGSFSTLQYLNFIQPVLKELQKKYDFDIKIICNKMPELDLKNIVYVEWSEANEISELASCQIGLMPLTDDAWARGKCGFKLIQYMALGIPAVSSSVGVNPVIIDDKVNGFICNNNRDWYNALEQLLLDADLRKQMGMLGRKKIVEHYSLRSNGANFLSLFN